MIIKKYFGLVLLMMAPTLFAAEAFISGKVTNAEGGDPEAGVWVIAETESLPTDYRKIVVTDSDGRFLLPELPQADYFVWVRGYGLADSAKTSAKVGDEVSIKVNTAKDAVEAAAIYPANYWLSMVVPPSSEALKEAENSYPTRNVWLDQFTLNCQACHQMGGPETRFPLREFYDHGLKKAGTMNDMGKQLNRDLLLDTLGDWGKRIHAGSVPTQTPPRPEGIERNLVITQWEYGDNYTYSHDVISTDKRNPHVNANGIVYGLDLGNDYLIKLDPNKHSWEQVKLPGWQEGEGKPWCEQTFVPLSGGEPVPSGPEMLGCPEPGTYTPHKDAYQNPVNPHNPMMDSTGRVWMTMQIRRQWGEDLPEFCKRDPVIADNLHHRQLGYYDPETKKVVQVDTCFGTHHLQFDDNDVLWVNGDPMVVGWLDTKKYDPDKPETLEKAMGWSESKIDTDGDGVADKLIYGFRYSIIPNPVDDDVWLGLPPGGLFPDYAQPGYLMRYDPQTDVHEAYQPPSPGYGPRGIDVDSKGKIWTALGGSGHLARFDRSRCKQTWGSGDQCPEGWTLWETPGPRFSVSGVDEPSSTDKHYYIWVDQFDTLGMGTDTVIVNGTNSDSLIAFQPDTETFTVIRVPYPLRTYTRGVDGRIDNKKAGWKGRGLWFTNGLDPIFMSEIPKTYVGHVQLRPNPLAH